MLVLMAGLWRGRVFAIALVSLVLAGGVAPAAADSGSGSATTPAPEGQPSCTQPSCLPSTACDTPGCQPGGAAGADSTAEDPGEDENFASILLLAFVFVGAVWAVPFLIYRGRRRSGRDPGDATAPPSPPTAPATAPSPTGPAARSVRLLQDRER